MPFVIEWVSNLQKYLCIPWVCFYTPYKTTCSLGISPVTSDPTPTNKQIKQTNNVNMYHKVCTMTISIWRIGNCFYTKINPPPKKKGGGSDVTGLIPKLQWRKPEKYMNLRRFTRTSAGIKSANVMLPWSGYGAWFPIRCHDTQLGC
jgi:hypothetical protein